MERGARCDCACSSGKAAGSRCSTAKSLCCAVAEGKTCGATVLRLGIVQPSSVGGGGLKGRIELAVEAQSYAVEASFFVPRGGGPSELIISGNTGDNFEPWRRNFPFREFFARSGDAACPPVPKVS
jgi:hypothetical protein